MAAQSHLCVCNVMIGVDDTCGALVQLGCYVSSQYPSYQDHPVITLSEVAIMYTKPISYGNQDA